METQRIPRLLQDDGPLGSCAENGWQASWKFRAIKNDKRALRQVSGQQRFWKPEDWPTCRYQSGQSPDRRPSARKSFLGIRAANATTICHGIRLAKPRHML